MRTRYSSVVEGIRAALSIQINQLVYDLRRQGQDVITLSLGEAFFDIPAFNFNRLDFARGYHYSDSQGLPELRRRIATYYRDRYQVVIDPDTEILISAGSKALIYMTLLALVEPGEGVVIAEPAWLSYEEQAALVGATVRFVPFDARPRDIGQFLDDNARVAIVCNPNNPAGRMYTSADLHTIIAACADRDITLIVDEAYSDFVLADRQFTSAAKVSPNRENLVVVNSLSKNMGMSGWRIGYSIASADTTERLLKLNQHIVTCAPTLLQSYLATYFDDILAVTLPQVAATVEKRQRVARMIDDLGLLRLGGDATFYFFVGIGRFPAGSVEFALYLLRMHGIAVVPGVAYGMSTDRFVRVSIGTESEERIQEALLVMRMAADRVDWDSKMLEQLRSEARELRPSAEGCSPC